jgi:outer membrane protein assembly factor BamD
MASRRRILIALLCAVQGGFLACSGSAPPAELSSPDRFEWSQERFDRDDFGSAARGFQDFVIRDPLNPLVDSAQYMMAESYLRGGRELEAAEEFSRLATTRPNSPWADDAQLGACRAYWEASPKVALSQEFTDLAIEGCQRLLDFFPTSPLRTEAERHMAEARSKKAEKSYDIAHYYYRRKLYESANVYLEKALEDDPSPELLPKVLLMQYRSYNLVGFEAEAATARERLLREFPDSEEAREARDEGDGGENR